MTTPDDKNPEIRKLEEFTADPVNRNEAITGIKQYLDYLIDHNVLPEEIRNERKGPSQ